jgi:hypothetical protein
VWSWSWSQPAMPSPTSPDAANSGDNWRRGLVHRRPVCRGVAPATASRRDLGGRARDANLASGEPDSPLPDRTFPGRIVCQPSASARRALRAWDRQELPQEGNHVEDATIVARPRLSRMEPSAPAISWRLSRSPKALE